jgi:hypothetical protein
MTAEQRRVAGWLVRLYQVETLELEYPTDSRGRILHPPPPVDWDLHEHLDELAERAHSLLVRGLPAEEHEQAWRDAMDGVAD